MKQSDLSSFAFKQYLDGPQALLSIDWNCEYRVNSQVAR